MSPDRRLGRWLLVAGVVLTAANLRPAVAGVGPVLDQIRDDLSLTPAALSVLTTAPVVCFGLVGMATPALIRTFGLERLLALTLAALTVGLLVRSGPGAPTLFTGTLLAASSIAVGNILLPAVVKRDFPRHGGLMTGLYTTSLAAAATVAAAVSVPIGVPFGWRVALGVWAAVSLVTLIVWLPQLRGLRGIRSGRHTAGRDDRSTPVRRLLTDPIAWQVTVFTGLPSLSYYAVLAWLPMILQSHGLSPADAGLMLALLIGVGIPVALIVPTLAVRSAHQRAYVAVLVATSAIGLTGLLLAPAAAPVLWSLLIGVGLGGNFPLALTLIVLRARTSADAAALSTMAQSAGFLIAATGPVAVGLLHDATGSWTPAVALLLAVSVPQVVTGLGAARNRFVGADPDRRLARTPA